MKFRAKKIFLFLKNKFILTTLIFFVWLLLFDSNNLVDRMHAIVTLRQLETDKEYYISKISEDSTKLHELRTNNDNLEKFAREQYLMKKDNEDLFVIVDKKKKKKKNK